MTRDQIEHIRRAAKAAQSLKLDENTPIAITFRAADIFARLLTPETVIELCNAALERVKEIDSGNSA